MRGGMMLALALTATPLVAQTATAPRGDDALKPRSVTLYQAGQAALAARNYQGAEDQFEAALVADPRNRRAFTGLSRASAGQGLYGNALRYAKKAATLEPTDRDALLAQGEAYAALGAIPRAKEVQAKMQKLCAKGCTELTALNTAIARGSVAPTRPTTAAPPPKAN